MKVLIVGMLLLAKMVLGNSYRREWKRLKGMTEKRMYGHELQSFIDDAKMGYFFNSKISVVTTGVYMILYILAKTYWECGYIVLSMVIIVLLGACVGLETSMALYGFSEIKHVSPNDGIGNKLYAQSEFEEAKKYYQVRCIKGLVWLVLSSGIFFITTGIYGLVYIPMAIIIFLLGMGDVLQKENYNDSMKSKKHKTSGINKQIFRYLFIGEIRRKHNQIMTENCSNIVKGITASF